MIKNNVVITPDNGSNDGKLTVTVAMNRTGKNINTIFSIGNNDIKKTLNVNQKGEYPNMLLFDYDLSAGFERINYGTYDVGNKRYPAIDIFINRLISIDTKFKYIEIHNNYLINSHTSSPLKTLVQVGFEDNVNNMTIPCNIPVVNENTKYIADFTNSDKYGAIKTAIVSHRNTNLIVRLIYRCNNNNLFYYNIHIPKQI